MPRVLVLARRRRWPLIPATAPLTRTAWEARYGEAIEGLDEGFDNGAGAFAAVVHGANTAVERLIADYPFVAWIDPEVRPLPPLAPALRARWRVFRAAETALHDAVRAGRGRPGQPDAAELVRQWEALLAEAEALDPVHPAVAGLLGILAHTYGDAGRDDERERTRMRVLTLHAGWLAPTRTGRPRDPRRVADPVLVHDWLMLAGDAADAGMRHGDRRRERQATAYYRRALALAERTLPPDHPRLRLCVFVLAQHRRMQRRYVAAEPLLRRLVTLDEHLLTVQTGTEHPSETVSLSTLAADLDQLVRVFMAQRRYAEAERLLHRMRTLYEQWRAGAPEAPVALRQGALVTRQLAEVVERQGRLAEAVVLYGEVVASLETGASSWQATLTAPEHASASAFLARMDATLQADALRRQGDLRRRLGDLLGAERAYGQALGALDVNAGTPAPNDAVRADVLEASAALLRASGQRRQAATTRRQASELRARIARHQQALRASRDDARMPDQIPPPTER